MQNNWPPQDQVFWYLKRDAVLPCQTDMHAEVVIIGGGMAGLAAAQAFSTRGKKVILLEQYYCGSGATGKSSGFITPNAELSFTDFVHRYDVSTARTIWDLIISGVEDIRKNIRSHELNCDYLPQDTIVVANSKKDLKDLEIEQKNLEKHGYKSIFYNAKEISHYIAADGYYGGTGYEKTFGISAYQYCQEMKNILLKQGVLIFEETPVTAIDNHILKTLDATITADSIIVCTDRFMPNLGLLTQAVYHVQTFILMSQVLTPAQMKLIFPQDTYMVWDSDLIYTYFRPTKDNRLLIGGGNLWSTYASNEYHNYHAMIKKLTRYYYKKFPQLPLQFEHFWPGLIGISKDIGPIAGRDKMQPHIYYIAAATGLPIAAALGRYSAEHMLDGRTDLDACFSPYRSYPIDGWAQRLLGSKISFAISNIIKHKIP